MITHRCKRASRASCDVAPAPLGNLVPPLVARAPSQASSGQPNATQAPQSPCDIISAPLNNPVLPAPLDDSVPLPVAIAPPQTPLPIIAGSGAPNTAPGHGQESNDIFNDNYGGDNYNDDPNFEPYWYDVPDGPQCYEM
jgi:hypothetical protein